MDILLSTPPQPVTGGSLQERIRLRIEKDILSGVRPPGSLIDEKALALEFNGSRTPVREALLILAAEGLIKIEPRVGSYVYRATVPELISFLEALAELEAVLAQLAAKRISAEERLLLLHALDATIAMADKDDRRGYSVANAALHEQIYTGARNPVLVAQVRNLRKRLAAYRISAFNKPNRLNASSLEHSRIVNAICAGNGPQAGDAMRDHILVGGDALMELVLASEMSSQRAGPTAKPHT